MKHSEKQSAFSDALLADGLSPELKDAPDLYGWLIGIWEADVIDYKEDGSRKLSRGEWHFQWVLEGRAVQDVWISPPRPDRNGKLTIEGNRYGTSIRVYDPSIDAWRITWINPVRQAFNQLIGRKKEENIVQVGFNEDGSMMRWNFSQIKPDSCRWSGEISLDSGKTWKLQAEFFLKRISH